MFFKDDLVKFIQFKNVIEQGSFDIKGRAITEVAPLFAWYKGLEIRIAQDLKRQEAEKQNALKDLPKIEGE